MIQNATKQKQWVTGYQKSVPLGVGSDNSFGLFEFFKLLLDVK